MNFPDHYLQNITREFRRYKALGDKTFSQVNEEQIQWRIHEESNSIAIIVKHMVGNMLSRWTQFLTEDGEKPWRHRDREFEDPYRSKSEMLEAWESGWKCVFDALGQIDQQNFNTEVTIRGEKHSIIEALNRQLGHYAYHVGQIVMTARGILGTDWQSLSIPKGGSEEFNKSMFGK